MTQLRKLMLEELQRRNYSQTTVKGYLKIVEARQDGDLSSKKRSAPVPGRSDSA